MPKSEVTDFTVVHISTTHEGGAGISARNLNKELNRVGINSLFLALERESFNPSYTELAIHRNTHERILSGAATLLNRTIWRGGVFSTLSNNISSLENYISTLDKNRTILHIHNWYNCFKHKDIFKLADSGFHVVLTLHDQRSFTGGCHITISCENFVSGCNSCPLSPKLLHKVPGFKMSAVIGSKVEGPSKVHLVAPSSWMAENAKKSQIFRNTSVVHIANPFPRNSIQESSKQTSISRHEKRIVIGAALPPQSNSNIDSPMSLIKGMDILLDLESSINRSYSDKYIFVHMSEVLKSGGGKQDFWSQIDYLIVPSRIDNSPNVIHEAKICGVPVIASSSGGILELLDLDFDIPVPNHQLSSQGFLNTILAQRLQKLTTSMRSTIVTSYENKFVKSLDTLIALYQGIISRKSL